MCPYSFEKIDASNFSKGKSEQKSIEDRYLAEFKEDKELYAKLKSLGLTNAEVKENILEILDYRADHKICQNCPGLSSCPKSSQGYCLDLEKDEGRLIKKSTQCPFSLKKMKITSRFIIRDYPSNWEERYFDKAYLDITKDRSVCIQRLVASLSGEEKKWIYVKGSHGSGASYILACFANTYADKVSDRIAFADTGKLLNELKGLQINKKETFNEEMNALENCGCLILDGFGNEQKTDYALSTILYPLLEHRSSLGKLTIFASNFSLKEVCDMYGAKVSPERANQLHDLILSKAGKAVTLNGIAVYND